MFLRETILFELNSISNRHSSIEPYLTQLKDIMGLMWMLLMERYFDRYVLSSNFFHLRPEIPYGARAE